MEDLVSIITPTYNCGKFISETIESVLNQSYKNWELIIVDDCSTDNTKEIVENYLLKDERIRYITLSSNSGAAVTRTTAMKLAKGEFMAFLDSDDLWYPNKIEVQLDFMKRNGYNITCTQYEQINENGIKLNKVIPIRAKTNYNGVLLTCPVGNSTVMYNVKSLGKFEVPNIRKRNDDALWLQMLKKEKNIYGLDVTLMQYRVRNNSISSNKLSLIKYHWKLYREIENLSLIRSVFHIVCWGFIKIFKIK